MVTRMMLDLNIGRYTIRRYASPWLVLAVDLFLVQLAFFVSSFIYFNFNFQLWYDFDLIYYGGIIFIISALSFLLTESYKGIIRHTSARDIVKVVVALLVMSIIAAGLILAFPEHRYGFGFLFIFFFTGIYFLAFSRLIFRYGYYRLVNYKAQRKHVLLYGAGSLGLITKNILESSHTRRQVSVVGFIDDDDKKVGKSLNGTRIYKNSQITRGFLKNRAVTEIVISTTTLSTIRISEITKKFKALGIEVKIVPSVEEWIDGHFNPKQLQPVKIQDLLSRKKIELNKALWNENLKNKTILVTGGAGSIGSEIVRQLLNFPIQKVLFLDNSESAVYELEQELKRNRKTRFSPIVGDVCDRTSMDNVFDSYKIDIIFHAAAYKHVPLMEAYPQQAVKVNIGGTKIMADMAVEHSVERFVLVSTDKAVNPTNVMGATKRAAEIYIGLKAKENPQVKFMTTRFGNVLGSNGSVILLFKKQIEKGGPVTVTHRNIIRYFMTIGEACQLVIEAGLIGRGEEIFVFDMGDPVRIYDLAVNMIQLSGYKFPDDINIKITGLRPGEKLYEELLTDNESTLPTHNKKIQIAELAVADKMEAPVLIRKILSNNIMNQPLLLVKLLKELIPEYRSNNSVFESLDKKTENIN